MHRLSIRASSAYHRERARTRAVTGVPRYRASFRRRVRHRQRSRREENISPIRSRHRSQSSRCDSRKRFEDRPGFASRSTRAYWQGPDRSGRFPLHHAKPAIQQNPEGAGNAERQKPRRGCDESEDVTTIGRREATLATPSLNQSDRERILIKLSFAGLNGRDDDQHGVQHPERYQDWNPDQENAKNRGDRVVNQHRDLEIQRFLSVRVDLRRVASFYQPHDKRA